MSGKLLMLPKLSCKSFIYDLAETFCFPSQLALEIYEKYKIEKIEMYHVLTDADSTALQFIIISDPNSGVPEPKFRDIIFEIIAATKIYKQFDSSHEFWDTFNARKLSRKKKLAYYKIESVDNPCYVTIAVNSKEYFEFLKNQKANKKHKGIKKGSYGMEFNNFAGRIKSLVNFDTFQKPPAEYKEVSLFTVIQGEMRKNTVQKTKFSQLNDKRFCFPNGIVSLPYGYQNLKEIDDFRKERRQKIVKYF